MLISFVLGQLSTSLVITLVLANTSRVGTSRIWWGGYRWWWHQKDSTTSLQPHWSGRSGDCGSYWWWCMQPFFPLSAFYYNWICRHMNAWPDLEVVESQEVMLAQHRYVAEQFVLLIIYNRLKKISLHWLLEEMMWVEGVVAIVVLAP